MQPEQTMQAHIDLQGELLMPIHNGTFDLAMHAWHEPFDRISTLAEERGQRIATPEIGQQLSLQQPGVTGLWWRRVA
jgi:L-ascorbate metabolism protein UlaG (beta-lactamase superfamily)